MRRYDLHVLANLLERFVFAAAVLFSLSWINSIFLSLRKLVGDIQNWGLFAKYTLQMLPDAILPMLPFSAFLSAAFLCSRMHARREFAIFEFTGTKPFRLSLPFALFGICIAMAASAIAHYVLPICRANLMELDNDIAAKISSLKLKEGQFLFLGNGLVVHIDSVASGGRAKNMFVHHKNSNNGTKAYFAEDTWVVQGDDAPFVRMINGRIFDYSADSKSVSSTKFSEFKIGIGVLLDDLKKFLPSVRHFTTSSLLGHGAETLRNSGVSIASIRLELHSRNAVSLLSAIIPLLGMSAMYACRRAGLNLWLCWMVSVAIFALVYLFNGFSVSMAEENANDYLYVYAPAALSLGMTTSLLWTAQQSNSLWHLFRSAFGKE
ncbi:MAG: LptF/LptG family permease [Albidovulum sp.]|nr:LptF/LptG family permease [Albidovulum sp.]